MCSFMVSVSKRLTPGLFVCLFVCFLFFVFFCMRAERYAVVREFKVVDSNGGFFGFSTD